MDSSFLTIISNWENELKEKLIKDLSKENKEIYIYLINNKLLEEYKKMYNKETKTLITHSNQSNNNYLFNSLNIEQLPRVSMINENIYLFLSKKGCSNISIKTRGKFYNKIFVCDKITLKNKIEKNDIYVFFFLNDQKILRQGYISIHSNDKEKILNNLKNGNLLYNINKQKNNVLNIYDNRIYNNFNDFQMVISENDNINIFTKKNSLKNNTKKENISIIYTNNNKQNFIKIDKEKYLNIQNENNKFNITENNKTLKSQINKMGKNKINAKKIIIPKLMRNPSFHLKKSKNENFNLIDDPILCFQNLLPSKAIHKQPIPGIIGLKYLGDNYQMNPVLQCLSNIVILRKELLNKITYNYLKNTNKKISFALAEVLKNLWVYLKKSVYDPSIFKKAIDGIKLKYNTPIYFINYLLQAMHKELNIPKIQDINSQNYKKDYINNSSIISKIFCGYFHFTNLCSHCQNKIHIKKYYNILYFPLGEIKKFKNYNHNYIRLNDCFDYTLNQNYNNKESFYCNLCHNSEGFIINQLLYIPPILIINLNRNNDIEFNINVVFEDYINLRAYISPNDCPYYYELVGVICSDGSNDSGAHFIAYCKNSNNIEWYKYNDEYVTKSYFNEVKENGIPYVLFYSYIKV